MTAQLLKGRSMKVARYYRGARTTHLERLKDSVPGDFFYMKRMYDFDLGRLPVGRTAQQVKLRVVLGMVWRGDYDILEIVEPYAPSALPQSLAIATVSRVARMRRGRRRTALVTYAIENADLADKYAARLHLPVKAVRTLLRTLVGYCYSAMSRVAYGTNAARDNYRNLLSSRVWRRRQPDTTVIEGLPAPRTLDPTSSSHGGLRVVFLGAFDDRKGVRQLIEAWPRVHSRVPAAELLVMGKGPFVEWVRSETSKLPRTRLLVDPHRERIWDELGQSTVLFLLSQPAPGWKEQIGLPIVEGLSVGLEVVASTESGIAGWLARNGHRVIDPGASSEVIAEAIIDALRHARKKSEVLAALPSNDGRLEADHWLHDPKGPPSANRRACG